MAQARVMAPGQPETASQSSAGLPATRSISVWFYKGVPLTILFLLIWFELLFPTHLSFAPSYLPTLNALVLLVIMAVAAVLAAFVVLRNGRLQVVWLGAGAVALGLTAFLANVAGVSPDLNASISMQSLGALLAGMLQFICVWLSFRSPSLSLPARSWRYFALGVTYGATLAIVLLITALTLGQHMQPFYVPGQGLTSLGQAIFIIATGFFIASAVFTLIFYYRAHSLSQHLYCTGLTLVGFGQFAYLFSQAPGDALYWLGHLGEWGGALYFVATCIVVLRQTKADVIQEVLASLVPSSAEWYRLLVQSSADAILGVNREGKIIICNQAAEEMFGLTCTRGTSLDGLLGAEVGKLDAGQVPYTRELAFHGHEGRKRWLELSAAPQASQNGIMAVVIRDVTERKEVEQIKDDFISMVSYELRTPLTVIIGNIKVALSAGLTEAQIKELIQDADLAAEDLRDLLENLVQLSRYQAGKLVLNLEKADCQRLLKQAMEKAQGHTSTHRYTLRLAAGLPPVRVDIARFAQVLSNLLSNAAKYSPEGMEITVEARLAGDEIWVSVTDQGRGISPEEQARLFQPFERLRESKGNKPGLGLGLLVSRRLVEAHGGRIWVESDVWQGSTFTFSLPADKTAPAGI